MARLALTLERGDEELEVEFEAHCTYKGRPATWNDPAEAPEYEIENVVTSEGGLPVVLTPKEEQDLYTHVYENYGDYADD